MADPSIAGTDRPAKNNPIGMMRIAGGHPDSLVARRTALGLFRGNLADLACTEVDLLAAFHEPGKWDYRDLWTREPLPVPLFADLLAVHLSDVAQQSQRLDHASRLAKNEIVPALQHAIEQAPDLADTDGKIDPRGALAWLHRYGPGLIPALFSGVGQAPDDQVGQGEPSQVPKISQDDVIEILRKRHPKYGATRLHATYAKGIPELPPHDKVPRRRIEEKVPKILFTTGGKPPNTTR